MIHKNIFVVATYPVKNPQHGGQKRLQAILEMYRRNFARVEFCGVFYKGFYKNYGTGDVALSVETGIRVQSSPFTGDIICGEAIYSDQRVKKKITRILKQLMPDIIHIEQPFAYIGLKPLLAEMNMSPTIVFGSQNIEGPMKREILEGAGMQKELINSAVDIIDDIEKKLSQEADLTVACTEQDLEVHKSMGSHNLVLAQNGIAPVHSSDTARRFWVSYFRNKQISTKILFVASAHPPSWTGFLDIIGKRVGFLPLDAKILMAGSISDYFVQSVNSDVLNIEDATFWSRVEACGRLSEEKLGALLELCDIVVLPITEGGGSNLKTAEAILANKKVVATTHALRSFEWAKDFPNVWLADNEEDFKSAILQAIDEPFKQRTKKEQQQALTVLWEYRLGVLEKEVRKL